jgi:hypothetical protein
MSKPCANGAHWDREATPQMGRHLAYTPVGIRTARQFIGRFPDTSVGISPDSLGDLADSETRNATGSQDGRLLGGYRCHRAGSACDIGGVFLRYELYAVVTGKYPVDSVRTGVQHGGHQTVVNIYHSTARGNPGATEWHSVDDCVGLSCLRDQPHAVVAGAGGVQSFCIWLPFPSSRMVTPNRTMFQKTSPTEILPI